MEKVVCLIDMHIPLKKRQYLAQFSPGLMERFAGSPIGKGRLFRSVKHLGCSEQLQTYQATVEYRTAVSKEENNISNYSLPNMLKTNLRPF